MTCTSSSSRRRFQLGLATLLALFGVLALPSLASASTYVVNTLGDSYSPFGCEDDLECTLRSAIAKANQDEDLDTIEFAVEGPIEMEIEPLPAIIHPLEINATTIPGYKGKPLVGIDGTNAQSEGATEGLSFLAGSSGSRVEGLAIGNFEVGVFLAGNEGSIHLCNSYVGFSADGVTPEPNVVGVETGVGATAMKIGSECSEHGGNRISGNDQYGIVDFGTGTKIAQNTIGLDVNNDPLPNGTAFGAGILVSQFAKEPYIGGLPGEEGEPGNVIAHNASVGVLVENAASNASIRRNRIYGNTEAAIRINQGTKTPAPLVEFGKIVGGEELEAFGTLHAKPEHEYVIDVFASASCYENSVGQGEFFLGSTETTTDSGGQGIFDDNGFAVPPAGAEYFSATATDRETGSTSVIGLCIDPPPVTEFTSVPDNPLDSTSASFEFTGEDFNGSVAGFQCSLDGGGFGSCSSPKELTGLEQGSHTYEVRAVDQVGMPDFSPAKYTWTVDTFDPTVEIESTPTDPSNSTSAGFAFSAEDTGSGIEKVECKLDGGSFSSCDSPAEYTGLADGPHSFEVKATDSAAHTATDSFSWTVDATAPTTTLETKPSNPSTDTGPSFTFSGTDGGTGVSAFECKLDGGSFGACTSPDSLAGLEDGSHTFEVRSVDNAGNTDQSPALYTWTVDTAAPTTAIESQPTDPSTSTAPSFTFSGEDPGGTGVAKFECQLDAAAYAPCTSPKALSGLADGSHTFRVRAVDGAGNTDQSPATYTWLLDATAPTTTLESKPTNPSASTAPSLTFSGADGGSGVSVFECKLDGGSFGVCASPDSLAGLEDGSHSFEVRAVDNAGNTDASPALYTWTVDATPPTTTIGTKPANPSGVSSPTFTFSGADDGTGVAGFECKLDAAAFAACTSPKLLPGLADGSHTFQVRAKDNTGNLDSSPDSYTWVVNSSIPAAPNLTATTPASPANDNSPIVIGTAPAGTTVTLYKSASCGVGTDVASASAAQLSAGVEVTVADDSVTQFSATATSSAQITSPCSTPISYRDDSTSPDTQIDSPTPSDPTKSTTASFFFSGADVGGSGVARFECRLDEGGFAPCASPRDLSGLGDGSHHFEVRAVDNAGNADATGAAFNWRVDTSVPPPVEEPPVPTNGESVVVAPEGGKVFVLRPGDKKPTPLKEGESIPVGSIVDATIGKVLLTSVNAAGEEQSAYFFGGKFLIVQHDGSGLVILKLRGDLSCGGSARQSGATASGKKSRKLWGSGHGNFRTEGSYGSATVRGTIWLTEDRCEGTYFKTRRGVVSVKDFTSGKTLPLPAGKTYLAQP